MRKLYKVIWLIWFKCHNKLSTSLFRFKLLMNGVKYGKNVIAVGSGTPQVRISLDADEVCIGNNVIFNNHNDAGWHAPCAVWVKNGATLKIGDNSGFNGVLLYSSNQVTIGKNVKVGGGTMIFDTDFHPLDYEIRRNNNEETKKASVYVEDDVFIGAHCIICKGVHIGARSIVGAGSVVVKDIPADEVWGGNPAKFIRKINL